MKLAAFNPRWLQLTGNGLSACDEFTIGRPINACGIRIDCPMGCADHRVNILDENAPDDWVPETVRLAVSGGDLRKVSVRPSVNVLECCKAHFTITDGEIRAA